MGRRRISFGDLRAALALYSDDATGEVLVTDGAESMRVLHLVTIGYGTASSDVTLVNRPGFRGPGTSRAPWSRLAGARPAPAAVRLPDDHHRRPTRKEPTPRTRRSGPALAVVVSTLAFLPALTGCASATPGGTLRSVDDTGLADTPIDEGWVLTLPADDDASWTLLHARPSDALDHLRDPSPPTPSPRSAARGSPCGQAGSTCPPT